MQYMKYMIGSYLRGIIIRNVQEYSLILTLFPARNMEVCRESFFSEYA